MDVSDEELVARVIAANDQRAFRILVQRHQGRVRSWLRQLSRDPARADDLAQETFVRVWQRLSSFTGKGKFGSWLMKIAYNEYLQDVRKQASRRKVTDALSQQQQAGEQKMGHVLDPSLPDLPKMLEILTDDERAVMVLCLGYGCSHGDTAEITGIPLGTVKSHVRRSTLERLAMSDELVRLFENGTKDVTDNGFSDRVMRRVRWPMLVRRIVLPILVLLTGWMAIEPVGDLVSLLIGNFTSVSAYLADVDANWLNQPVAMAVALAALAPAVLIALEE